MGDDEVDLVDEDDLLDEDDLAKPDPASLRGEGGDIFKNYIVFVCLFVSGEPCFQGRPIRFRILMPSPFIHTERPVTGPCCKLLARYFGSLRSSQSQRPAERRVSNYTVCNKAEPPRKKNSWGLQVHFEKYEIIIARNGHFQNYMAL